MKKISKILISLICIIIITGCSNSKIDEITYNELETLLNNKESFILEIVQDECHNCESFSPKFRKVLKRYGIDAKQINLTNLSEEDNDNLKNLYNASGTPTVIFIEKGEEPSILRRIVGDTSEEKIVKKLKIAGYIK